MSLLVSQQKENVADQIHWRILSQRFRNGHKKDGKKNKKGKFMPLWNKVIKARETGKLNKNIKRKFYGIDTASISDRIIPLR